MFGKIMSMPDPQMWPYFELLTERPEAQLAELRAQVSSGVTHPREVKISLAQEITAGFHGPEAAKKAADEFQRVFRDRLVPEEMEEIHLERTITGLLWRDAKGDLKRVISPFPKWAQMVAWLSQAGSISEAARIIEQGGLEVNGQVIRDPRAKFDTNATATYVMRTGKKKFLRVVVE